MSVKLIGITAPSNDHKSAEDLIVYMARVSNPGNQNTTHGNDKLIRYLIKNQHWSPFEMVSIVMEINTTRDIARQILRHRSFSFQEFSQRYAEVDFGIAGDNWEQREARLQDTKNRQNSIDVDNVGLQETWKTQQSYVTYAAEKAYRWALDNGIAKEQARAVLPEGLTKSKLYMSGNLRSWIHYCELRRANGTQKEHMEIAEACWSIIKEQFPNVASALEPDFNDYGVDK
jgi:thymidylate synthase (FAD)